MTKDCENIRIDCAFPGGNAVVKDIQGDVVTLRQDLRDTTEWWFYWSFMARNACGKTVRFVFTDGDVFGAEGPCFSSDRVNWEWLGREIVDDDTAFSFTFPHDRDSAWFSFCIPYTETELHRFLAAKPEISIGELVRSEKRRTVERLVLPSRNGRLKIVLTARHHACETMANYVLEGLLDYCIRRDEQARFLREQVDIVAIPFIDKDGVEDGDQGKARAPHDHNRDYTDAPLYASTQALMSQLTSWRGELAIALDLHCPWIRDGRNEEIFLVEPTHEMSERLQHFSALLAASQQGKLIYNPAHYIPFEVEWNQAAATCARFMAGQPSQPLAAAVEFPYAVAGGQTVTAENARQFGTDLGRAIALYLQGRDSSLRSE